MAEEKKPAKDRIKAKAKATKAKVKAKVKASVAIMAAILSLVLYEGCSTATPASRATTASYEFRFELGDGAKSVTINTTLGDGALASADSAGSTETQTATPTTDIKPDVDLNYAQGGGISTGGGRAASGAAGIIETLAAEGLATLKDWVTSKKSGTVTLQKKDGSTVTADCKDGVCTFADGTTVTAADCQNCTDCTAK